MNSIDIRDQEGDNENEGSRLSDMGGYNYLSSKDSNCNKIILFSLIIIIVILCLGFVFFKIIGITRDRDEIITQNNDNLNAQGINKERNIKSSFQQNNVVNNASIQTTTYVKQETVTTIPNNNIIQNQNGNIPNKINEVKIDPNKKIGIAFVYNSLHSNGIAKFIVLTADYLIKTGRYDICFITSAPSPKDYKYNKGIKRFNAMGNYTKILEITLKENIDIFILHNVISIGTLNIYHHLGKKVITIFHGLFVSPMTLNNIGIYRSWKNFDLFDSYIFISSDDYYLYKKLGFQNEIFVPNLNFFEEKKKKSSNLTYNNILMLGKFEDPSKGGKYAIETMDLIIKQVPNAILNIVASEKKLKFMKELIKKMNLTKSVFIVPYTNDLSSYYLNSSVLMYTSSTEGFPMSMIEGKAHGLPIVAFDVPYSPPYQDGVIVVEAFNTKALAEETIKLLNDYNYRKRMGEYAKKSLDKYSNQEIILTFEKLFKSLRNADINEYRNLQKEVEAKYYKEEESKNRMIKSFEHIKKINNNLACHTLDNFADANYLKKISECKEFKGKKKVKKSKQ